MEQTGTDATIYQNFEYVIIQGGVKNLKQHFPGLPNNGTFKVK